MPDSKISELDVGLVLPDDEFVTRRSTSNYRVLASLLTNEIFNVKNYGAVGDGSTDDITAIQAAVDAAEAEVSGGAGGAIVYFPAGTYVVSTSITVREDNIAIIGNLSTADNFNVGRGTTIAPTVGFTDGAYILDIQNDGTKSRPLANVRIANIGISKKSGDTLTNTVHGMYFKVYRGHVENVFIDEMSGDSLIIQGHSGWNTYETKMYNVHSRRSGGIGLGLLSNTADMHFTDCVIHGHDGVGIYISGGASCHFVSCHSTGNLYDLHMDGGGSRSKFIGCKFEAPDQHCIVLESTDGGIVDLAFVGCNINAAGTLAADNTYDGMYIFRASGGNVVSAVITGCTFQQSHGTNNFRYHLNITQPGSGIRVNGCRFDSSAQTGAYFIHDNSTRCTINNIGRNVGDPNSTGAWNGNGEQGIQVFDSNTDILYTYANDRWIPIPSDTEVYNVLSYGAVGDGATDDTSAIQAAIDAASTAGGGRVYIPAGVFVVTGIVIKNRVWLEGAGHRATVLYLDDSSNDHVITSYKATGSEANAQSFSIKDLMIDGNKDNQTAGEGIHIEQSESQTAGDDWNDARWIVQNVIIYNCKSHGFRQANWRSEGRLINVHAFICDGHGFYAGGSDTFYITCNAGACGLAGFYITNTSTHFTNCKAWFNGTITSASGHGFHLDSTYPGGVILSNCDAQDNEAAGFFLNEANSTSLTNCVADSNGRSATTPVTGDGAYAGFEIDDSRNCILAGCVSFERRYDSTNSFQRTALNITGSSHSNKIDISHSAGAGGPVVNQPLKGTSNSVSNNDIVFNSQKGYQTVSYASSIIPNPYLGEKIMITLTGNITISNVTNTTAQTSGTIPRGLHAGCMLTFIFAQDGTGGRTVTWDTTYKVNWTPTTTANKINTIQLVYNGTNWVQVGSQVNLN